jgi:uncharacterized protein
MEKLEYLSNLTIRKPVITITDADVDGVMLTLRAQRMRWKPVKRSSKPGDRVTFEQTIRYRDRVLERSGKGGVSVVLGKDASNDLRHRTLLGARSGDQIVTTTRLPADSGYKDFVGKRVTSQIEVVDVCRPVLPRLDRRFAAEMGFSSTGRQAMRNEVRGIMRQNVDALIKRQVREQIFSGLLEKYPLTIDNRDLEHELERRRQVTSSDMRQGVATGGQPQTEGHAQETAVTRLGIILRDIVRERGIMIDPNRLSVAVKVIARRATRPKETIEDVITDFEHHSRIEAELLEDQAVEAVIERARVIEVPSEYRAIMKSAQAEDFAAALAKRRIIQLRRDNKCSYCATTKCCTYITQVIPTPRSKADFDHLLWQVAHENVEVMKDGDGWHLLIRTKCAHLQNDGRCGIYETRPKLCRDYSNTNCEFSGPAGRELHFPDYESMLSFCKQRFRTWDA